MDKVDLQLYQAQASTNVSFTAFMTAVVVFFTSLLLTKFDYYNVSIKIPISFLIISIFGFLYSTIVFANASGVILKKRIDLFKKHENLGNALSEYLGVYLLILSIPLVINVITNDIYLQLVTILSALIGLSIYQFSEFSIMQRQFKEVQHLCLSFLLILFGLILFLAQKYDFYFVHISIIFLIFILVVTYLGIKNK